MNNQNEKSTAEQLLEAARRLAGASRDSKREAERRLVAVAENFGSVPKEENNGRGISHSTAKAMFKEDGHSVAMQLRKTFAPYETKKSQVLGEFTVKQIVLIPYSSTILSPNSFDVAVLNGLELVKNSVTISKSLTSDELTKFFQQEFPSLQDLQFDIMKKEGSALIIPPLQSGASMNGFKASQSFYQRKIYLRPWSDLTLDTDLLDKLLNTYDPLQKTVVFRGKQTRKRKRQSANSDDEPAEKAAQETIGRGVSIQDNVPTRSTGTVCGLAGSIEAVSGSAESTGAVCGSTGSIEAVSGAAESTGAVCGSTGSIEAVSGAAESTGAVCGSIEAVWGSRRTIGSTIQYLMETSTASVNRDVAVRSHDTASSTTVEISDDDDEEFVRDVIHQIPAEERCENFLSVREVLQKKVCNGVNSSVVISRGRVFQSALLAFKIMKIDPKKKTFINFSDQWNAKDTEPAIDAGGPMKEFLRLLFEEVSNSNMFEGPIGKKNLMLDYGSLRNEEYKLFGVLCAMAIAYREAPLPNFFSEELYDMIITNTYERKATVENIADIDILKEIEELSRCDSPEAFKAVAERSVMLAITGVQVGNLKSNMKEKILEDCLHYYVNERMQPAFRQLLDGLETLGLLSMIRTYPHILRDAFVNKGEMLTAETMKNIFRVDYGDPGNMDLKNDVLSLFYFLLYAIEAGNCDCSLEDVLIFFSSMKELPLGGFFYKPTIKFNTNLRINFPDSRTCQNELILPLATTDFEEIKANMCPIFAKAKALDRV